MTAPQSPHERLSPRQHIHKSTQNTQSLSHGDRQRQEWKQRIETTNCRISVTPTDNESWLIAFEQLPGLPYVSLKVAVNSDGTATLATDPEK